MANSQGFLPPFTPDGGSALIPEMPWHYSGTLMTVEYRTDPANVRAILPPELDLAPEDPGAVAFIWADWQSCSNGGAELLDPSRAQYLEAFVVDPKDDGYDVMSWVCTTTGEDCLEAAATGGGAWDGLRAEASPDQPWFSSSLQVPPFFAEFVDEQPLPLIFHYTLACLPGRCP
jgi:hypothetical protein